MNNLTIEPQLESNPARFLNVAQHRLRKLAAFHRADAGVRAKRGGDDFFKYRVVDNRKDFVRQRVRVLNVRGNPDMGVLPRLAPLRSVERDDQGKREERGRRDIRDRVQRATNGAEAFGSAT